MRRRLVLALAALAAAAPLDAQPRPARPPARRHAAAVQPAPLAIGETFTMRSAALGETRRINVWVPPGYAASDTLRLPVMYMPDGGIAEDFLHVMGLLQVGIGNGTMRPFILVGIENTQRRRDLTGPTTRDDDRKIAPRVGGSAAFRTFLRDELRPLVDARWRTTRESAIVGESLAGLFVVETFLLEPALFDAYVAIDPSLWWNGEALVDESGARLAARAAGSRSALWMATSHERDIAVASARLADTLRARAVPGVTWHLEPMPEEGHGTIYHPAALRAFRALFAPPAAVKH